MKATKNFLLMTITLMLLSMQNAFAWGTKDFGNDGPHPELLAQANCVYNGVTNYYATDDYYNHYYSGSINGMAIWGRGSDGANTGLGLAGTGFHDTGSVKYFVGRLAETVKTRHQEGKDSTISSTYKFQICSISSASLSYYGYENSTSACPANTPSGAINIQRRYEVWTDGSVRNYTDWYETSRSCTAVISYYGYNNSTTACPSNTPSGVINIQQRYEVWTDGSVRNYTGWYETSRTCAAVFSYYGYNNSTSACPSTTPSGVINIQQRYDVWTDGSVRNYTGWYETSRTCAAAYQSTETGYQYLACSTSGGAYTEGGNGITQSRTRQIWSDGARAWSGWTTISNTCYKTVSDTKAQNTYACAEGQTGKIVKEPRRTHIEYATDAAKTQAEKDALNDKNATIWIEYTISNTCTNVPDKTWTETGTKSVTCESVKGSGYTGIATQTGTYTYTYSSATKKTTSTFTPTSTDTSSCSNATTDVTMETQTKACPSGQTGAITEYRYVATDSTGAKTYPQGATFQTLTNTCSTNNKATDNSIVNADTSVTEGLLSNSTLKTSDSSSITAFTNFTKNINASTLDENNYKLNLVVDSMITSYSASNVSNAINAFNNKVNSAGKTSEITINLPKDLSKYGKVKDTTGKSFEKAVLNKDGTATITYQTAGQGLGKNTTDTFNVNVLQGIKDTSNITVN